MRTIAIATLAAVLAVAGPALAADRSGEVSIGFNTTDAPVGLRYFASENVAVDAGLGFESTDLGAESATSFFLEGGLTYVVFDYDDSFFFVRPAVAFSSLDDRVYGTGAAPDAAGVDATWTVIDLELNLGAEVRLAERFGLTFQHGLRFSSTSLPDEIVPEGGEDSYTDFSTFGENVTEAGVWFTF